jgi:glycosyltransferase involved in cell wall biosynthesis
MGARVHFVNRFFHPDHSATSQVLSGVAFDLARHGHAVHVTTSRQLYEDPAARLPAGEIIDGVRVHRVAGTRFGRTSLAGRALDYLSFYLGAARSLWRNVGRGDVVIAKTDPPLLSLVAAPVARLRGARYVNWLQDVFPEVATGVGLGGRGGRIALGPLRRLRNWSLKAAHRNVVIGERMGDLLVRQGIPRARITTIPNWSDANAVQPVPHAQNRLRREWGLEGKVVVGYSGNLGRVHDIDTIVAAIAEVERRRAAGGVARDIAFVFIGGGAKRKALEREIERRGLTGIRLHPYQPQELLAETLSLIDIHLVSLLPEVEGLVVPSKLYGTMAVARPTLFIGADDGEVARIIARHGCGLAVGIGEGGRLADAILALAADEAGRQAMGEAARAAFLADYTKQIAALSWHNLITGLATGSAKDTAAAERIDWREPALADATPVRIPKRTAT